jgi:hypothetical protein
LDALTGAIEKFPPFPDDFFKGSAVSNLGSSARRSERNILLLLRAIQASSKFRPQT